MNQTVNINNTKPKGKTLLIIFSFVSLALIFIGYIFGFDYQWSSIIIMPLRLVPPLLFAIYFMTGYSRSKAPVLITIGCALIASLGIISVFQYSFAVTLAKTLLLDGTYCISFILAAIFVMKKGTVSRVFAIIAASIGMIYNLISLLQFLNTIEFYIDHELDLFLISTPSIVLGWNFLYVALLLFGICHRRNKPVPARSQSAIDLGLPPEQALLLLREKYTLGAISEDEYLRKREEIVRNL